MSAKILAFPRTAALPRPHTGSTPFTQEWCDHHLPLDAAMDLLSANEVEFARRCQLMANEDGRLVLDDLSGQLDRLGTHIADVADALTMTAMRIRSTIVQAEEPMHSTALREGIRALQLFRSDLLGSLGRLRLLFCAPRPLDGLLAPDSRGALCDLVAVLGEEICESLIRQLVKAASPLLTREG